MKLKTLFPLFVLMLGIFTFVACGDDDHPFIQDDDAAAKAIVGTYTGWTHLESNYINKNYASDTLTLALADDHTLTATFLNKTWGIATIKGIKAQKLDDCYAFSGGEGSFVMNDIRQGGTQEFPCKVGNGVVSLDLKTLQVTILATMTMAGGHGDMIYLFQTGEMPTTE